MLYDQASDFRNSQNFVFWPNFKNKNNQKAEKKPNFDFIYFIWGSARIGVPFFAIII